MKKNLFITAIIAIVLCISCRPKGTSNSNASEEEKVDYLLRDTAIYGFCAEGSAMNTSQQEPTRKVRYWVAMPLVMKWQLLSTLTRHRQSSLSINPCSTAIG